jgi:hypothetical protein
LLRSAELAGRVFADVPAAIDVRPSAADVSVLILQQALISAGLRACRALRR